MADGWAARNFDELKLRESEEMKDDRAYLERLRARAARRRASRCRRSSRWAIRRPSSSASAEAEDVDLIAMSTHGHRFLADILHGATADRVRHLVRVPVLLLRAHNALRVRRRSQPRHQSWRLLHV